MRPEHIDPGFTAGTLRALLAAELDVQAPFIVVAQRKDNNVSIRARQL